MVFIEPTPYIIGFISAVVTTWTDEVDVLFLKKNATQQWNLELPKHFMVLPASHIKAGHFFWQCLFKKKYDLIHVAGWSSPICLLFIIFSPFIRIPVTVESDTQLNLKLPLWKKIIKRIFYPILFKLPALFFAGGARQMRYFQHYGVKSKKIVIMQMTVDVTTIQRQAQEISPSERLQLRYQYHATEETVVFLFVGRLLGWKGLHELMTAFKTMDRPHAQLWIVGDGELKPQIETMAMQHEAIHYFGRLSGHQLILMYNAADVVVIPSHFEPWGLVVNEAMATGKAVIASEDVGCRDDLVIPHKTGLVIKPQCVTSLCEAMQWMIDFPDQREKMAKAASAHIASWTLDNEANNVTRGWQALLSNVLN